MNPVKESEITMASVEKFSAGAVRNQLRHNRREIEHSSNPDIDPSRQGQDYVLSPDRGMTEYDYFLQRKSELYCYNRDDVKVMQGCVNYEKRIKKIEERISNNEELTGLDRKFWCVYTGLNAVTGTMFNGKPFTEKEEDLLNRNWLQHGRTHRTYTRMDFLKALLLVDGILFFAEQGNAKSQIEEDKA